MGWSLPVTLLSSARNHGPTWHSFLSMQVSLLGHINKADMSRSVAQLKLNLAVYPSNDPCLYSIRSKLYLIYFMSNKLEDEESEITFARCLLLRFLAVQFRGIPSFLI